LSKKSKVTGFWQKRYFVLSESSTHFCVLRIYNKAVLTKWGFAPLQLKTSIPLACIEQIDSLTAKGSSGKEFVIKFCAMPNNIRPYENCNINHGDSSSVNSDGTWQNDSVKLKVSVLQADSAQTRLLWVTMLNKALNAASSFATID
jgi:hypothetical protein